MSRLSGIPVSPVYLVEYVRRAEKKGIKVTRFDVAEPLFNPPEEAIEDTIKAVKEGAYRYSPPRGIPELVDAVAEFLGRTRGLEYDREEIIVTPGAKFAIYAAFTALLRPGDEAVMIAPCWVTFRALPTIMGAKAVEVPMKRPFGLDEEALKEAVTDKCRLIVLNNPHNPTGWVFREEELKLVADLAEDHDLTVVSDEVDWPYVYEGRCTSIASLPGMKERTLVVDSLSKAYAMTGWRVGFAAGPKRLIDDMLVIQQHSVSSPATFSQAGCVRVLERYEESVAEIVETCRWNRDHIVSELSRFDCVECPRPPGGFSLFPSLRGVDLDGVRLMELMLEYGVAVAPGELFGEAYRGNFRLCYAMPREMVVEGVRKLVRFFEDRPWEA